MRGKLYLSAIVVGLMLIVPLMPFAAAPPNHPCEPWPECRDGGGDPPALPVIAYQGDQVDDIMVMNADGSNQVMVFDNTQGMESGLPSWSPDGASIAFVNYHELWRVDVVLVNGVPTGQNAHMIAADDACGGAACLVPAWSPLGTVIATRTRASDGGDIWLVPSDGGVPTRLYTSPAGSFIFSMAWRSDGTQLAFSEAVNYGGPGSIKVLDLASGTVTTVLGPSDSQYPFLDWSETEDLLAYSTVGGARDGIYTLDLTTGDSAWVDYGKAPTFSPDTSKIAFQDRCPRGGFKMCLWSIDLVTEETVNLARGTFPDWARS